jgi:hypothetical protein
MSVQASIVKGIAELLLHHEYVIVPKFGGFVTRLQSAYFNATTQTLYPPAKKVSFNAQLKQNDGMLECWLQEQLSCTREEAGKELDLFSEYCHSILQIKKRLVFDTIGFFYLNFDGQLCFEPQAQHNFNLDSYGLSPVITNELQISMPKKETEFKDRVGVESFVSPENTGITTTIRPIKQYRKYALPTIAGLLLFGTMAWLISTNPVQQSLTAGFWNKSISTYKPITYPILKGIVVSNEAPTFVTNAEGYASLNIKDKTLVVNVAAEKTSTTQKTISSQNFKNSPFKIVVGCFSVANNATRLVKRLQDQHFKAFISGTNAKGMQIVSCGGYTTKEEALEQLPLVKNTCPNAWIMAAGQ